MSVATLLSRVTGLGRTWFMALALGNSMVTSAYQVANNMPNVVFDLVAGGLLGAAFIPVFMEENVHKGQKAADAFASNVLNLAVVVLGALSLLSMLFAPQLIATQTFVSDAESEVVALSVGFFRIFAFQILFYGISSIVTCVLNARRRYFWAALSPALNNICVMAAFGGYMWLASDSPEMALNVLGIGTTVGVAVQALVQLPVLAKCGFSYSLRLTLKDEALISALKVAVPTMIYIAGTLVAFSFRNALSLGVGDNGPATLAYAWTWFQLPYGVLSVSLTRALFTEMSDAHAKSDEPSFSRLVSKGLSGTVFLMLPLAGLLSTLSVPIMELFQVGAFGGDDVVYVASILSAWCAALPLYAVFMFLYNVYAARMKFMFFALTSTVLVVLQCVLYVCLCREDVAGLFGVPIADFLYYGLGCVVLLAVLAKREKVSVEWDMVKTNLWKGILATALGCAIAFAADSLLPQLGGGMIEGLLRLAVAGFLGLFVAYLVARKLHVSETELIGDKVQRIMGKIRKKQDSGK